MSSVQRPASSAKKRRLALAPLKEEIEAHAPAAAAAGAGAAVADVIDLTADDEHAFASAWREFELIDLTADDDVQLSASAAAPRHGPKPAAAAQGAKLAGAAGPEDVLAHQRAKIRSFLRQRGAARGGL